MVTHMNLAFIYDGAYTVESFMVPLN